MAEYIILGVAQGITEWLPVSSEGVLVLLQTNVFGHTNSLSSAFEMALFLHLGTFLAALIYFRKDVKDILKTAVEYGTSSQNNRALLKFLIVSTIISGSVGGLLIASLAKLESNFILSGRVVNLTIGIFLVATAVLQIKSKLLGQNFKNQKNLKKSDGIILGVVQGLAALPGLSRSGLTVSALLVRKFDDSSALRLSFLMSLPIVFAGNILLGFTSFTFRPEMIWSLAASFVFGMLTIDSLLKFARRVSFGHFVLIFGIITILASLIT